MPEFIQLIFIRHGQTAGNLRRNYIGRTDEPLCPEGAAAIRQKKYPSADLLFCSPMRRCLETAAILYPNLPPQIIADLRECDFGDFENHNYQDLSGNPAYQRWLDSNGGLPFPGGESREQFAERCCRGLRQVLTQISLGQRTALVVHGGTIMSVLAAYADTGEDYYSFMCENGGGYRCVWDGQSQKLRRIKPLFGGDGK